jgi:hypothetical protein
MAGAADTGICGFLYGPCSELVSCEPSRNICYEPNHICVHHPRCSLHPVCYPVSMMDQRICPPITSKRIHSNLQIQAEFEYFLTVNLHRSHNIVICN